MGILDQFAEQYNAFQAKRKPSPLLGEQEMGLLASVLGIQRGKPTRTNQEQQELVDAANRQREQQPPNTNPAPTKEQIYMGLSPIPVVGDIAAGVEAVGYAKQGKWGQSALAGVGMLPFIPSAVGMFAGKGAKGADLVKMLEAQAMLKRGVPDREAYAATGWTHGFADKMPRFEIDDSAAMAVDKANWSKASRKDLKQGFAADGIASEFLDHPQLYQAYDPLIEQGMKVSPGNKIGGSYGEVGGRSWISTGMDGGGVNKSTTLHELQHAIQGREGFARGGTIPSEMTPEKIGDLLAAERKTYVKAWTDALDNYGAGSKQANEASSALSKADSSIGYKAYKNLAGESEARLTQARMRMTAKQRAASYPPDMFDVPVENQLVRFGDGPAQSTGILGKTETGLLQPRNAAGEFIKPTKYEKAHKVAQKNAAKTLGLPADNTAMDRAKAMGFDTPAYHGTNADISAFDLSRSGSASGAEQYGSGIYTATSPSMASGYANPTQSGGNVMPLMVNMQNPITPETVQKLTKRQIGSIIKESPTLDDALWNFGDVDYEGKRKVLSSAINTTHEFQNDTLLKSLHPIANDFFGGNAQAFNDAARKVLKKDGVMVSLDAGEKFPIPWNPNQVRSRFAAFDPAKRDSSDLLAGLAPYLGISGLLGAGMLASPEAEAAEKKKRKAK